jgi:hypothetical protein
MLSDCAPSLDGYRFVADFKRLKFTSLTALLSPWQARQRMMSAQRPEVNLWRRFVAAIALISVCSPDSARTSDLGSYLNPLLPLYATMGGQKWADNALTVADFALFLPHVKVYGQALMDYFRVPWQNDWQDTLFGGPNCTAVQVGVLADLARQATLRYEYATISNYTYYHRDRFLAYSNYGVSLGHPLGPDADQHYVELDVLPNRWGYLSLLGSLTRRGSLNRGDFGNRTYDLGDPARFHAFPSRVVENTLNVGPQLILNPVSWLNLVGSIQWYAARNSEGVAGARRSGMALNVSLDYRY